MLNDVFSRHLGRLKAALMAHSPDTILEFIINHTRLNGENFSFLGHEYQERILRDKAQDIVIVKSAQMGISEMSARLALAKCALIDGFSVIYTLPSASAAANFMKTRIDPVVMSSPYLSELISADVDNAGVKRFGDSYLYLKGCQVDRQAISVPADMLVTDEVDNSDLDVMTLFHSRLIHSKYANTVSLSTPTIPGYGISRLFDQSKRKVNLCKCTHCNEWFQPDYFQHVRIPNCDKPLDRITKTDFADPTFRWAEAFVACPKCGRPADLMPENREWVEENQNDAFVASGYRVSPFDCPTVIKVPNLVKSSADYERFSDFCNQRLGIAKEDTEVSLSREEVARAIVDNADTSGASYVMGVDLGMTCWVTVAAVFYDNSLCIVHVEPVPMQRLFERFGELVAKYRVRAQVIDHAPYTELVYRLQQRHPNAFASVYVTGKSAELMAVREKEENADKAQLDLRQVNVQRNNGLSLVADMLKTGQITKLRCQHDAVWIAHMLDQKRVRKFMNNELQFVWVKTTGQDHLSHSLLYAVIASKLLSVRSGYTGGLPMALATFKQVDRG